MINGCEGLEICWKRRISVAIYVQVSSSRASLYWGFVKWKTFGANVNHLLHSTCRNVRRVSNRLRVDLSKNFTCFQNINSHFDTLFNYQFKWNNIIYWSKRKLNKFEKRDMFLYKIWWCPMKLILTNVCIHAIKWLQLWPIILIFGKTVSFCNSLDEFVA